MSNINLADEEQRRRKAIQQANANQALEGLSPDAADVQIQERFAKGEATADDLLAHALDFATKNAGGQK